MKRPAEFLAALVCGVIALAHLLRLLLGAELTVAGFGIPREASALPVLFFGGLAAWLAVERQRGETRHGH